MDSNSSENNSSASHDEELQNKLIEKQEDYRMLAATAFAGVLLLLGLPLWWMTTTVYRVSLPHSRIEALSELDIKFTTNISLAVLEQPRGEKLVEDLQNIFKISKLFKMNFEVSSVNKELIGSVRSVAHLEALPFNPKDPGKILLLEVPGLARFTPNQILVGRKRTIYFSTDADASKIGEVLNQWLLHEQSLQTTMNALTNPILTARDMITRRRIPAAKEYDVMFTVVNPEPEKISLNWNLPLAIDQFIRPFIDQLSYISDFTMKSQWLYFVTLEVQPKLVSAENSGGSGRHFALSEDILPQIITPLEKKLASHVSKNPTLNFVLYVPPCKWSPLHIYRRQGVRTKSGIDAFLSPRWGGIAIYNPSIESCSNASITVDVDSQKTMSIFLTHLRLLLGIQDINIINRAETLPLTTTIPRMWEIDALLRVRTLEHMTSAKLTLQSLSQLLGEISNIVINDDVGDSIHRALNSVENAGKLLRDGDLKKAYKVSKEAFLSAEAAFSDPSLLALLYFPDDQKYAVYIPLFLPVTIPVVMSLSPIYCWLKRKFLNRRKKKQD